MRIGAAKVPRHCLSPLHLKVCLHLSLPKASQFHSVLQKLSSCASFTITRKDGFGACAGENDQKNNCPLQLSWLLYPINLQYDLTCIEPRFSRVDHIKLIESDRI